MNEKNNRGGQVKNLSAAGILCCLDTAWDPSGQWMDRIRGCILGRHKVCPYLRNEVPLMVARFTIRSQKTNKNHL